MLYQKIQSICDWLNDNVCQDVNLLKPDNEENARGYETEYTHPHAFPLFIPTMDRKPPDVETTTPCICVRMMGGEDFINDGKTTIDVQLAFATWRYGSYIPDTEGVGFVRNQEGWKENFMFLEIAKKKIEKTIYINGMRVDRSKPIKYGMFEEKEEIPDTYPFWYTYLSFSLTFGNTIPNEEVDQFL